MGIEGFQTITTVDPINLVPLDSGNGSSARKCEIADSPWQKSCVVRISHRAASHQLYFFHCLWVPHTPAPPVTQISATTACPPLLWAIPVRDTQSRHLVRGPKAVNKPVAKGESRAVGHAHPPHRSPSSLSLPVLSPSFALAQLLRRSAPKPAEPRKRARVPPPLLHPAPLDWTRRCADFLLAPAATGTVHGVSCWPLRAIALR